MTHYTLEFGGGLGDIFDQLYYRGAYNVLRDLEPNDTATVLLVTHNPHAKELFEWHPKRMQFDVQDLGYWMVEDDARIRAERGLPPAGSNNYLPIKDSYVEYHVSPEDRALLNKHIKGTRYIVLAPGAGMSDRNIPWDLLREQIIPRLLEIADRFQLVAVGRNYDRHGRSEYDMSQVPGVLDLTDKLTVPGTAWLTKRASGLVTAHSALNLLAWNERVPQLLLYPQSVLDRHFHNGKYDQWMRGALRADTVHGLFSDFTPDMLTRFIGNLRP